MAVDCLVILFNIWKLNPWFLELWIWIWMRLSIKTVLQYLRLDAFL